MPPQNFPGVQTEIAQLPEGQQLAVDVHPVPGIFGMGRIGILAFEKPAGVDLVMSGLLDALAFGVDGSVLDRTAARSRAYTLLRAPTIRSRSPSDTSG